MTAHKTKSLNVPNDKRATINVLNFDPREFFEFLDGTNWSDEQKAEYVTLVWNIVREFIAMGWGVHPLQQAAESCGKTSDNPALAPHGTAEVLDSSHGHLIEEFVRQNRDTSFSGEKGERDG
ncbi:MAG: hypothetical protein ACPGOY_11565 [Rhodospirillaceae bacterium]